MNLNLKIKLLESKQFFFFLSLIAFAICMRFLPHFFNVTPIMAVALLSGFHFKNKNLAVAVPLTAMLASDYFIGLHTLLLFIYVPILLSVFLGSWLKRRNPGSTWPKKESLQFSLLGSSLFFVVSNLGVFFLSGMYTQSTLGLTECFAAALPFFERSLLGDFMFTAVLFAAYSYVIQMAPYSREARHG